MIESQRVTAKIAAGIGNSDVFDVILIGGGIMGCCTAYELSRRGLSVAIVDKGTIGEGPTGKSSAIIRQHYSNELTARMAYYSLGIFQNFEEIIGGECGFTKTGFLVLVDAKDQMGLESNIALHKKVGIDSELIAAETVSELIPGMKTSDLVSVAYEPESGYADPYLTVTAFARAARRLGTTIIQDTRVIELSAPFVINCSGAWGAQVAAMAGIEAPIDSCRVQVAFFRRPQGYEPPHPVVADFINATYFRSETGGLTLVGLIDPAEADAIVNPDDYQEYMDDGFLLEAGERLVGRYPVMTHSESTGGYASLYAVTPDWHPVIDEVPAGSGFFICSGFSGHGFKLGPAVGIMTADLITGVRTPQFDPSLFRFGRFADNILVTGGYEYSIVG
jgi:sarcosine oxidase subunit beta